MDLNMYQAEASKTFKPMPMLSRRDIAICNWALGAANEAGELAGEIKHIVFHQESLDKMKIAKEIGDQCWYLSALCTELDIDLADCLELNLLKLQHRHGKKGFSFEGSTNRHEREQKLEDTEEYLELRRRIEGD